jgi:hypothetical protein
LKGFDKADVLAKVKTDAVKALAVQGYKDFLEVCPPVSADIKKCKGPKSSITGPDGK